MNLESIGVQVETPRISLPAEQVSHMRKRAEDSPENVVSSDGQKNVQAEELLNQIKAITEDGLYSVQFENDPLNNELIVKIIDRETNEVIRQIPPKELLELSKHLQELSGNIVETSV